MNITKMMPMDLILSVIEFVGITEDDFASKSRKQPIVITKVIVSYCLLYMGVSNTMIGKIILKDHASITHYKKLVENDLFIQRWIERYKKHMEDLGWYVPSLEEWENGKFGVRMYKK
jgi:chromosomal replication initiation ATPase DnaA